jgi:hypothetical protein
VAHGHIMQRKFDDLDVGRMTAQIAGDAMTLIAGYNATAPWAQLGGDELKKQVKADKQTLEDIKGKLEALTPAGDDVDVVRQVQKTVGLHLKQVTAQERRFEAEAFAAKPLKEKYLVGLGENINVYKTLVGDTLTDTADVSDQALSSIIALYSSEIGGKVAWTKEATLRARQAKGLGGNTGWVTELLGPHRAKAPAGDVLGLIGEATTPDTLSIETMIKIINTLHSSGLPGSAEIEEYLGRQINKRTRTESAATVEEKTRQTKEKAAQLRSAALAKLGTGKTWNELKGAIATWREALKNQAQSDTFFTMYKAGRMTVRAVAPTSAQQGGKFEANIPYGETSSTTGKATMTLERGRQSILTRIEPATWTAGASELAVKQQTGLYELAASLLDPDRTGGIYPQLKFYSAPEAVVFTPAASPEDQAIFAAISELADADQPTVRAIGSEMTRIILAQSSDMGTKYVDKS